MAVAVGTRIGSYEIVAALGAGGMGEVYRARDRRLDRDVAIKLLPAAFANDPDRLARFEREAKTLAALNHPNIATIYGIEDGPAEAGHYGRALVLELVDGPTLADRIAGGPVPLDEALPVARQIAEALEAAHENGVIHRDLKPANIKLRPDGTVKVLDFGLAKLTERPRPETAISVTASPTITTPAATGIGVVLGTAAYMAPEQARGKAVDKRADVWAFGCVLYETLTGTRVFAGDDVADTIAAVLRGEPDWKKLPAETPASIRRLLRRCLEKDARERLADIGTARLEIRDAREEAETRVPFASTSGAAFRRGRAGWITAAVGAAGVALIAGAAMLRTVPPDRRTVRFAISPPPGTSIAPGPAAPQLAVSPDGRYLAFAAVDGSGVSHVWVRGLDSMTARQLPGTEDGWFPFWSPDGAFIGFQTATHLKVVRLVGGDVLTVCENARGSGATWSPQGVIVLAQADGTLHTVPAGGGVPQRLTALDPSRQETAHLWPQFLPDGRRFLFFARSSDVRSEGIYVASIDGGQPQQVLPSKVRAVFAAGHLLFLRGATLMAQPFDPDRIELVGTPTPIAEGVTYNPGTNRAGFSASDGGVLAFRTGGLGGIPTSQLVWFDRKGNRLGPVGPPGPYGSLALSPDETRVAFDRFDSRTGTADIWIHDLRQGRELQLTFDDVMDTDPLFSPDGVRILFASRRSGKRDLYRKNASGTGEAELLLATTRDTTPADWNGSNVVVLTQAAVGDPSFLAEDVALLTPAGAEQPFLASTAREFDARVSPDGRWLAYVSDFSGRNEVYAVPFSRVADGRWRISTSGGTDPWWRADGKELFYLDVENRLIAVAVSSDGPAFQYGTPQVLFQSNASSLAFAFRNPYVATGDGERFLFKVDEPDTTPITVVVNWLAAVER